MANRNPSPGTRFQRGQSGNPAGQSSERQKLREQFVKDLYAEWVKRGADVLAELSPKELVTAAADAAGKDVNVSHTGSVAHTHEHTSLSETDQFLREALGIAEAGALPQSLPN